MSTESETSLPSESRVFPRGSSHAFRSKRLMVVLVGTLLLALMLANQRNAPVGHGPLWHVLLAGAGFLYLWWLGTLVFDLVFVWHRYIQHDGAMKFLRREVKLSAQAEDHGPDDRPHGTTPADILPTAPSAGAPGLRPIDRPQNEGTTMTA